MPDEVRWPRRWKCENWPTATLAQDSADGKRYLFYDGDTTTRILEGIAATCPECYEVFDHHPPMEPVDVAAPIVCIAPPEVPYFDSRGLPVGLVWPRSTGGAK